MLDPWQPKTRRGNTCTGCEVPGQDENHKIEDQTIIGINKEIYNQDNSNNICNNMGTLKVVYTNADGLVNMRHDLKILLHSLNEIPDIIAIREFKPKK